MRKDVASIVGMAAMLVLSVIGALLLAPTFAVNQLQAFPNPTDPINAVVYIVLILAFTAVILLLFRFRRQRFAKYIVLGSIFLTIFVVLLIPIWYTLWWIPDPDLQGNLATVLSLVVAALVGYALYKYPEWYIVDGVGIVIAAGVTAILGISFAILPTFLLLIFLALYDAWAVYRSKHMVTLADEMTSQRLPILLVMPKTKDYSYREQGSIKEQIDKGEEREAMFMGLGDIIIPGTLVVSAFTFLAAPGFPATTVLGIPSNLLIAVGTLIGALVGFSMLMRFVMKGNPQAGLPLLNGGAIAGYLITFALLYGGLYHFGLF